MFYDQGNFKAALFCVRDLSLGNHNVPFDAKQPSSGEQSKGVDFTFYFLRYFESQTMQDRVRMQVDEKVVRALK